MSNTKIQNMLLCAMFTALTAVMSQIALPIGPVPVNLGTFAVFCAGALLKSKTAALSLGLWTALGAFGAPVFAMFRSGLGTIAGPTGGYIIAYMPAAYIIALFIERSSRPDSAYPAAMLLGMLTYFTIGTAWFVISTGSSFWEAILVCVIPFIPGDLIKISAAVLIAKRLRPVLKRTF